MLWGYDLWGMLCGGDLDEGVMIRVYLAGDAKRVLVQEVQAREAAEFAWCFDKMSGYSLVDEKTGEVLGVFSYQVELNQGKREAWCYALFSKHSGRKMLEAVRFLQKEIGIKMKDLGIDSVLMTVKKGFVPGVRLALALGFKANGVCPAFYEGVDYQIFERSKI